MERTDYRARVIMIYDGTIHIAHKNNSTFLCTVGVLSDLLTHSRSRIRYEWATEPYINTNINPANLPIDKIPGVTLAYITADGTYVCQEAVLHSIFLEEMRYGISGIPLIFTEDSAYWQEGDPSTAFVQLYTKYVIAPNVATTSSEWSLLSPVQRNRLFSLAQQTHNNMPESYLELALEYKQFLLNGYSPKPEHDCLSNGEQKNSAIEKESSIKESVIPIDTDYVSGDQTELSGFFQRKDMQTLKKSEDPNKKDSPSPITAKPSLSAEETAIPEEYCSLKEYAQIHNLNLSTVRAWAYQKKFKDMIRRGNNVFVNRYEKRPTDGRAGRKMDKKAKAPKGSSYGEVQAYIADRNIVTAAIQPYIYHIDEARYYEKKYYHEVGKPEWERPALIVDVDLAYCSPATNRTNKEIMLAGDSPVVPGAEIYDEETGTYTKVPVFHVHHIGRRKDSPFAIIPETDHNSKEYYAIFHAAPESDEPLHTKEFEEEKKRFWENYLRLYFEYGDFQKIPYTSMKLRSRKK